MAIDPGHGGDPARARDLQDLLILLLAQADDVPDTADVAIIDAVGPEETVTITETAVTVTEIAGPSRYDASTAQFAGPGVGASYSA